MKHVIVCLTTLILIARAALAADPAPNTLSAEETKQGWKLLWDGKTSTGWRSAKNPAFPEKGWQIKDGVLTVLASPDPEKHAGGDIITVGKYSSFELLADFKITPKANSGIKCFVDAESNNGANSSIGLEYQILDDALNPDAKLGPTPGCRTLASLYDLIAPIPGKKVNPLGEWNTAHIINRSAHGEHWLNGQKVLEYERFTPEFRKLVAASKYNKLPDFGEWKEGHILLQDHGNEVSFRNIKIRILPD